MAGPGGGPPRKSHTKSRKGCRTCKNRHIRCDELFPQCRNCTKHQVRCDYMDMTNAGEDLVKGTQPPELMTTPEMQHILDNWRITGEAPLPELQQEDTTFWKGFSTIDLRLVHHITSISLDMTAHGYNSCTAWTPQMNNLIKVALTSEFTMHALLALSASHLAWETKNNDTENLAFYHQGLALQGVHDAIGSFSEQNSDAILAASMLLSWQATDARGWMSLQQGLSTVLTTMRQRMHKSELATFVESQRALGKSTPTTPSISGFSSPPPTAVDESRLNEIKHALRNLRGGVGQLTELVPHVDWMIEYVQQVQEEYPARSPEQAFNLLVPLRTQLFWLPSNLLRPEASDLGPLAILAHLNAVALAIEPFFPEVGGLYLGTMSLVPIDNIREILQVRRSSRPHETSLKTVMDMIDAPIRLAQSYRNGLRASSQAQSGFNFAMPASPNLYSGRSTRMISPNPDSAHSPFGADSIPVRVSMGISPDAYYAPYTSPAYSHSMMSDHRSSADLGLSTNPSFAPSNYGQPHNTASSSSQYDYFAASQYQQPYGGMSDYNRRPNPTQTPIVPSSTYNIVPPPSGQGVRHQPHEATPPHDGRKRDMHERHRWTG